MNDLVCTQWTNGALLLNEAQTISGIVYILFGLIAIVVVSIIGYQLLILHDKRMMKKYVLQEKIEVANKLQKKFVNKAI